MIQPNIFATYKVNDIKLNTTCGSQSSQNNGTSISLIRSLSRYAKEILLFHSIFEMLFPSISKQVFKQNHRGVNELCIFVLIKLILINLLTKTSTFRRKQQLIERNIDGYSSVPFLFQFWDEKPEDSCPNKPENI